MSTTPVTNTIRVAAWSDPGRERDYQEDNYCVGANPATNSWTMPPEPFAPGTHGVLLVVADGMGGLNAGEVASDLAVKAVKEYFSPERLPVSLNGQNPGILLTDCIAYANNKIVEQARQDSKVEGMGTTLVIAWLLNGTLYVGWCGDSRCYLLRQGQIKQISKDHSYVQELIDKHLITEEEAFFHPNKNIITQSLGDVGRPPVPEYTYAQLEPGDRVLVCSDGLNSMLHDYEIAPILAAGDAAQAARALVDAANDAGGHDNITVVIGEVEGAAAGQIAFAETNAPELGKHIPPALKSYPPAMSSSTKAFLVVAIALFFVLGVGLGYVFIFKDKPKGEQGKTVPEGSINPTAPKDTTNNKVTAAQKTSPAPAANKPKTNQSGVGHPTNNTNGVITEQKMIGKDDLIKAQLKLTVKNLKTNMQGVCRDKLNIYEQTLETEDMESIKRKTCALSPGCGSAELKEICGCMPGNTSRTDDQDKISKMAQNVKPAPPLETRPSGTVTLPITSPSTSASSTNKEKYGVQITLSDINNKNRADMEEKIKEYAQDDKYSKYKLVIKEILYLNKKNKEAGGLIILIEDISKQEAQSIAYEINQAIKRGEKPFVIKYSVQPNGRLKRLYN